MCIQREQQIQQQQQQQHDAAAGFSEPPSPRGLRPAGGSGGLPPATPTAQQHQQAQQQEQASAELERSKASVARLLKEREDLDEKLRAVGKELKQAINEKSVQVGWVCVGGGGRGVSGLSGMTVLNRPEV